MKDFKLLFCEHHRCPAGEYEERAFRECLHWQARILAPVIRRLNPEYFAEDFALIRYLGECKAWRSAKLELATFSDANHLHGGFSRKWLRLRVSSRKATKLARRFLRESDEPAAERKLRVAD